MPLVVEDGAIKQELRLPFAFDLEVLKPAETFLGATFQIHHELEATVARPWYTFAIASKMPLLLLSRVDSPMSSVPAAAAAAASGKAAAKLDGGVELQVGGVVYRLECTNAEGGLLPGGAFEGILTVEGATAEGEAVPRLFAVLQRVETLKEDATVAVAPQANHSGSTSAVDVMEKALTEAQDTPIAAGRYAVKFSCKPEPLPQPEVAAGEDKPPPHVNVLPPPLALTEFKKEEPDLPLGAYAAHYQLKFEVRLPPAPGSQEPLRASSEPLKLTVFE